nr:zinc finger, CCHC-type [Tanacetum cinerariifolium]
MLKPSNYSLWEIRMQIILEANGLWEMIEPLETTKADNKKDKTTIAFLYQALPEEQLLQITKHKTAKSIWDALKTRHIGEERVQQARLQTLKSDFEMLHMKEDETIDTLTEKLTTLVNKAASLGHTIEDQTLVRKLLNVVPDRYIQIFASIEQYFDLSEMTTEEAIERLKTNEERIKYKKGKWFCGFFQIISGKNLPGSFLRSRLHCLQNFLVVYCAQWGNLGLPRCMEVEGVIRGQRGLFGSCRRVAGGGVKVCRFWQ